MEHLMRFNVWPLQCSPFVVFKATEKVLHSPFVVFTVTEKFNHIPFVLFKATEKYHHSLMLSLYLSLLNDCWLPSDYHLCCLSICLGRCLCHLLEDIFYVFSVSPSWFVFWSYPCYFLILNNFNLSVLFRYLQIIQVSCFWNIYK